MRRLPLSSVQDALVSAPTFFGAWTVDCGVDRPASKSVRVVGIIMLQAIRTVPAATAQTQTLPDSAVEGPSMKQTDVTSTGTR